jgi:hypothetical protein
LETKIGTTKALVSTKATLLSVVMQFGHDNDASARAKIHLRIATSKLTSKRKVITYQAQTLHATSSHLVWGAIFAKRAMHLERPNITTIANETAS